MSGGRRYDEHGEVDDRNFPVDRADHPVWRLLSAQVIDRSGLWIHGQSPPAKPLPGRTRPRGGAGHTFLALPTLRRSNTNANLDRVVGSGRRTSIRNPSADGILLFSPVAERYETQSRHSGLTLPCAFRAWVGDGLLRLYNLKGERPKVRFQRSN